MEPPNEIFVEERLARRERRPGACKLVIANPLRSRAFSTPWTFGQLVAKLPHAAEILAGALSHNWLSLMKSETLTPESGTSWLWSLPDYDSAPPWEAWRRRRAASCSSQKLAGVARCQPNPEQHFQAFWPEAQAL